MATKTGQPRISWKGEIVFTLVALLVILAISAFRWVHNRQTSGAAFANGGLTISPEQLNFGEVWETSQFNWPLTIQNPQDRDVEIQDLRTSCTCSQLHPRSLKIPAGQQGVVQLTLDLTAARSKVPDAEWRDFQVTLSPRIEDAWKVGWTVGGRVHTAIRLEQPVLDLGRHSEAEQPLPKQKSFVTSYVRLTDLHARPSTSLLSVEAKRSAGKPPGFELLVSPAAFPVGPIEATIALTPQLEDGVKIPPKSIVVVGRIVSDFQASPPEAVFGGRALGEVAEETLTLYSLTKQLFEVVSLKTEGEELAVEKAAFGDAASPTFILRQRIGRLGHQEGRVVFRLRDSTKRESKLEVPVSYLGIRSQPD